MTDEAAASRLWLGRRQSAETGEGPGDVGARTGHREFRAALRVRCDGSLRDIEETGFSRIVRRA